LEEERGSYKKKAAAAHINLFENRVSCTWGELRDGAATGPPAEEKRIFV